jgi:hypothetical protein
MHFAFASAIVSIAVTLFGPLRAEILVGARLLVNMVVAASSTNITQAIGSNATGKR